MTQHTDHNESCANRTRFDSDHARCQCGCHDAEQQAADERAAFLGNLQREGDKMAAKLSKDLGMPVDFDLKPSRLRRPL